MEQHDVWQNHNPIFGQEVDSDITSALIDLGVPVRGGSMAPVLNERLQNTDSLGWVATSPKLHAQAIRFPIPSAFNTASAAVAYEPQVRQRVVNAVPPFSGLMDMDPVAPYYPTVAIFNPPSIPSAVSPAYQVFEQDVPSLPYRDMRSRQPFTPITLLECRLSSGSRGILLAQVSDGNFLDLYGGSSFMYSPYKPIPAKTTLHIIWPGYEPYRRQIVTRTAHAIPRPISFSKLTQTISTEFRKFLDNKKLIASVGHEWLLYPEGPIRLEHVLLVEVKQVSKGSIQAFFAVVRP